MKHIEIPIALVVEDVFSELQVIKEKLESSGFTVLTAQTKDEAYEKLNKHYAELDLLLVDLMLEGQKDEGWKLITYSSKNVNTPSWCRKAILTGHPETERAAPASDVEFFIKTKDIEAFYKYIDEVAYQAINRRKGEGEEYPEVTFQTIDPAEEELNYDEYMSCKAIRNVSEVKFIRRLSGSFQKKSVLLVSVTPRDSAPQYTAVVKSTEIEKAKKELLGYEKLRQYFSKIGKFIPPPQDLESLITSLNKVLITPKVNGITLYTFTREQWMDDTKPRVSLFKDIFLQIREFLQGIHKSKEKYYKIEDIFEKDYIDSNKDAKRRFKKTFPILEKCIGSKTSHLNLVQSDLEVINPTYLLQTRNKGSIRLKGPSIRCEDYTYAHGDLHAFNVVVSISEKMGKDGASINSLDELFILDYDRVGTYCKYYDLAQLETSFLMAISFSDAFVQEEYNWNDYFKPALFVLCDDKPDISIHNNRFTYDLIKVLRTLRGEIKPKEKPIFKVCLFTTMLRIFTSHCISHLKEKREIPLSVKRTGVVYMGLILNNLVSVDHMEDKSIQELAI